MQWIDKLAVFVMISEPGDGIANRFEASSEVFSPVCGHEHDALRPENCAPPICGKSAERQPERIDYGISYRKHRSRIRSLLEQCASGGTSGSEMESRHYTSYAPVHFFREGTCQVERTQPGFYMPYRNRSIESGEGRHHGRRRVSLHKHGVRLCFPKQLVHVNQRAARKFREGLVGPHQAEVVVGANAKPAQNGVKQFAMLPRDADEGRQLPPAPL
jgi:hypothetical protein